MNFTADLPDNSQNGGRRQRRRNIIAAAGVAAVLAIIVTVVVVSTKDDSRPGTYVNCNNQVGSSASNCSAASLPPMPTTTVPKRGKKQ